MVKAGEILTPSWLGLCYALYFLGHFRQDIVPRRVGIPQNRLSGFEKFETPDSAEWTARGYAIVNSWRMVLSVSFLSTQYMLVLIYGKVVTSRKT